ncbi:HlyD family secretion protein [Pedobacter miscanthi]|uniref:HlyD family secretion protein n=1 Tax=Pedobacter miscanthi TaxID=2259170 RepID=UPI0029301C6A|nr:HlyD family efflux transporter periplasmic adaptor subunit [Pedobacter miscanthi]
MPDNISEKEISSDEVQEIITAVPTWILRWGITLVFSILGAIIVFSSFINYPDVIRTNLRVNCLNAPKPVLAKQTGKLTTLLVSDGQSVRAGQSLGYFESTAKAKDVCQLVLDLKSIQTKILKQNFEAITLPQNLSLGEMQISYQNFFQQYLQYQSTVRNGYYIKRLAILEKDLKNISTINHQIQNQQKIQRQEYSNQQEEYNAYRQLYKNKVISRSEFAQQENKFLASKYPLQQSETALLSNSGTYSAKEKDLLDLRHTIMEEQAKFVQALNQCITEGDNWIMQHVLIAPVDGILSFAGIVQENQNLQVGQEVFIVNPGNTDFFGEIQIPQENMGKIVKGASTLVKMRSYPFEQYGLIRGKLSYISDVAYRDSVFIAKVTFVHFENKDGEHKIILKNGMKADAEIITEESSLLNRFFRNFNKILNTHN